MPKLYDKNDPNQLKEDQAPYGDETSDDPSPAAVHGRVVRLETNAKHVATQKDIARVEGKIDTVNAELKGKIDTVSAENKAGIAELSGKIDTVSAELSGAIAEAKAEAKADNAELSGKIDTVNAENKAAIAEVKAENAWNRKLLYTILAFLAVEFAKDNQTIASIIHFLANFFR